MSPATSQNPKTFRHQVGSAIWLLLLFLKYTPADWNGTQSTAVADAAPITDKELSERLGLSITAVARSRCRLRRLGLIGWLVVPGLGRAFWISAGLSLAFEPQVAQQIPQTQTASGISPREMIWRVLQERSIAVTGKIIDDLTAEESERLVRVLAQGSKNPTAAASPEG